MLAVSEVHVYNIYYIKNIVYCLPVLFHSRARKTEWKRTNGSNRLPIYISVYRLPFNTKMCAKLLHDIRACHVACNQSYVNGKRTNG